MLAAAVFTGGEVDSPSRNLARYISWMADRYNPEFGCHGCLSFRRDLVVAGIIVRFNDVGLSGCTSIMETNEHYDRQHIKTYAQRRRTPFRRYY